MPWWIPIKKSRPTAFIYLLLYQFIRRYFWRFHTEEHWNFRNYLTKFLCKKIQISFGPIVRSFVSDPFQKSTMNIYPSPTIEGAAQKYDQTIITHIPYEKWSYIHKYTLTLF